jgi:hypothetical protein
VNCPCQREVPTLAAANKNALEIIVRSTTDENGEPRPIRRAALYDSVPFHLEPSTRQESAGSSHQET